MYEMRMIKAQKANTQKWLMEMVKKLREDRKRIEKNYIASEHAADARIKELEEENKRLKEELQHYKNTEAIQKSNDASRWKPWCMKYVDMELNHF